MSETLKCASVQVNACMGIQNCYYKINKIEISNYLNHLCILHNVSIDICIEFKDIVVIYNNMLKYNIIRR